MNQDLLVDCIERAVGPVRASGPRKDRMREELAAHLAASWEEERARGGDDSEAASRAVRRLGDIDQLGRDLRDSVPRLERWLFTPLPYPAFLDALDHAMLRKEDETPLHNAARVTMAMCGAIAIIELIGLPLLAAIRPRPHGDWPTTILWAVASLAVVAAGGIVFPMLREATIRALRMGRRRCWLVALSAGLSSLALIALGLGFVLIVSLDPYRGTVFVASDWFRLLAVSLVGPPALLVSADAELARRSRDGWGIAGPSH